MMNTLDVQTEKEHRHKILAEPVCESIFHALTQAPYLSSLLFQTNITRTHAHTSWRKMNKQNVPLAQAANEINKTQSSFGEENKAIFSCGNEKKYIIQCSAKAWWEKFGINNLNIAASSDHGGQAPITLSVLGHAGTCVDVYYTDAYCTLMPLCRNDEVGSVGKLSLY